jgi:hypothetical protein
VLNARYFRPLLCLITLGLLSVQPLLAARAMVIMDDATITHALRYGSKKADRGYQELLGPNWRVGGDGTLLNIYTPYMALAAKAYRSGFPVDLDEAALKNARRKLASDIRFTKDPNQIQPVKMVASLFGDSPTFTNGWQALITGTGNGRTYEFRPFKTRRPTEADKTGGGAMPYEGILSFYFKQVDLLKLEGGYTLTLTDSVSGRTVAYRLRNDELY